MSAQDRHRGPLQAGLDAGQTCQGALSHILISKLFQMSMCVYNNRMYTIRHIYIYVHTYIFTIQSIYIYVCVSCMYVCLSVCL